MTNEGHRDWQLCALGILFHISAVKSLVSSLALPFRCPPCPSIHPSHSTQSLSSPSLFSFFFALSSPFLYFYLFHLFSSLLFSSFNHPHPSHSFPHSLTFRSLPFSALPLSSLISVATHPHSTPSIHSSLHSHSQSLTPNQSHSSSPYSFTHPHPHSPTTTPHPHFSLFLNVVN